MLIIHVLNILTLTEIPCFSFMEDEAKPIALQIWDTNTNALAVVDASVTGKILTLASSAATDVILTDANVAQHSTIPSIFTASISSTNMNLLETGNITLQWTKSSATYKAVGQLKLKKQTSVV